MKVCPEEAQLMLAATAMTKKMEATESELVAAHAALERAIPSCRDCSKPIPSEHSLRALEEQGIPLLDAIPQMRADGLEVLMAWKLGFCNAACRDNHAARKEQSATHEAENVERFRKALRVVKEVET